ncbi:MAG: molybdenum cofactor guanylyltransferase [Crocosphaera sp.]
METALNRDLSAIILAGGQSTRMGEDKALLKIQGVPLLERTAIFTQAYVKETYIVTPWIDRYSGIVPPNCHLLQEKCQSGVTEGPLVGFAQGLPHVTTEWLLLLACDLPNLTNLALEECLQQLESVSEEAIACLPRHQKGWEPLCGFYRTSSLRDLESFIEGGGRAFQRWLQLHYVEELFLSDRSVLFNCNTPKDLSKISN